MVYQSVRCATKFFEHGVHLSNVGRNARFENRHLKGGAMSRYIELNMPVDSRVPAGYQLILAYAKDDLVRIPMDPRGLDDDDHNCDWEGCSTVSHCLSISPQQKYLLGRAAELAKGANLHPPTAQLRKCVGLGG